MNLARLSLRRDGNPRAFSAVTAALITPQRPHVQSDGPLRVAAPPRAVWKSPAATAAAAAAAAAVGASREARVAQTIHPEVSHFILPRPSQQSALIEGPIQPQQVGPAPPGDLRLVEFMEQVKLELWEFNAMPLRKRFRIQSLLRCVSGILVARGLIRSPLPFFVGERERASRLN